jgi:hypothetical protein
MCQFSALAENTRDARQGEDLVVSMAPHASSHWLTEPGKPDVAVCIPHDAPLALQIAGSSEVRGGRFEHRGNVDSVVYLDGAKERVALNNIPCGSKARVLALSAHTPLAQVPAVASIPARTTVGEQDGEPVPVEVGVGPTQAEIEHHRRIFRRYLGYTR